MAGSAARLEVVSGKAAGMSLLIDDELVIGRLAEGAGRLADDEEISRSHARLSLDSRGLCAIEDLGSTNGTFVNGMRVTAPQTLSEGDTIELGSTTMVVREIPSVQEDVPPAPVPAPPAAEAASEPRQATASRPVPEPAPDAVDLPTERIPEEAAAEAPAQEVPVGAPPEEVPVAAPPEEVPVAAPAEEVPEVAPAEELAAPAVEAPPAEAAAAAPSTLSVQLDIDFGAREVQIRLDDATEPVRLVFDGDSWRPAP